MASDTIVDRLDMLENRIDELRRLIDERLPSANTNKKRGWRGLVGKFKDDPYYEEAMRLGREWRDSQFEEIVEDGH